MHTQHFTAKVQAKMTQKGLPNDGETYILAPTHTQTLTRTYMHTHTHTNTHTHAHTYTQHFAAKVEAKMAQESVPVDGEEAQIVRDLAWQNGSPVQVSIFIYAYIYIYT